MRCVVCRKDRASSRSRGAVDVKASMRNFSSVAEFLNDLNLVPPRRTGEEDAVCCSRCSSAVVGADDSLGEFWERLLKLKRRIEPRGVSATDMDGHSSSKTPFSAEFLLKMVLRGHSISASEEPEEMVKIEQKPEVLDGIAAADAVSSPLKREKWWKEPRLDDGHNSLPSTSSDNFDIDRTDADILDKLPPENPANSEDWNKESDHDEFLGIDDEHDFESAGNGSTVFRCELCPSVYKNPTYLFKHHAKAHAVPGGRMCWECGRGFASADDLERHVDRHRLHVVGRVSCIDCRRPLMFSSLREHIRRFHGRSLNRTAAERAASGNSYVRCMYCKYFCAFNNLMELHVLQAHSSESDEGQAFQCDQCPRKYRLKHSLVKHQETHGGLTWRCDQCGKAFNMKSLYLGHLLRHKRPGNPKELCPECGQEYQRKSMAHHRAAKHGVGEILYSQCHLCPERFSKPPSLRKHLARAHKVGEYRALSAGNKASRRLMPCDVCGHEFRNKEILAAHKFTLHKIQVPELKDYVCRFCGSTFYSRAHLTTHLSKVHGIRGGMAKNTGETQEFACKLCPERFEDGKDFARHLRGVHDKEVKRMKFEEYRAKV